MNIDIDNQAILQKYSKQQIQQLFTRFVDTLEKQEQENTEKNLILLHEIDYEDLIESEKKSYNQFKNYDLEDFEKAGFC